MSETALFIGIIVFVIFLIICIHVYDRYLVKEIKIYERRLEEKGIFKRHFIKNNPSKKKMIIKTQNDLMIADLIQRVLKENNKNYKVKFTNSYFS